MSRKYPGKLVTTLVLVFVALGSPILLPHANAQNPRDIKFVHLTADDGLPSLNLASILQDSQGFMWIGTNDGGLGKFDGVRCKNYVHDRNDPTSIPNNCTWRLYQDPKGNIWIATWGGGLARYEPCTDAFVTHRHDKNDKSSLSNNHIWSALVDRNDVLWVGTDDGFNRYDAQTKSFVRYHNDPADPTSLSCNNVTMVLEGAEGFLWIGTYGGGLNRFDIKGGTFFHYRHDEKDPHSLGNDSIHNMFRDKDGTLWIGTIGGLDKLDPKTNRFTHFRHDPKDPQSISGDQLTSIFRDSKGRLWLGTGEFGVNLYDPETGKFHRFQNDRDNPHSLADNTVWGICEDGGGTIWFTTFNGLDRYDATGSRFNHYKHFPGNLTGLSHNSVQAFSCDQEGMLWIGTRGGGLNRFDPDKGTFSHYFHESKNPASLSHNNVMCMAHAKDGTLWIGTGAGLDQFSPGQNKFQHYCHDPHNPTSMSPGAVRDLAIGPDGHIWIGIYGGGLDRFDPVKGTFTHFMPKQDNPNSLISEWTFAVFVEGDHKVWVGTENGVSCLETGTGTFNNYSPADMDFNTRAIYQDREGTIWIGTNGGLHRFNRDKQSFTRFNKGDGLAGDMVVSIIADDLGFLWIGTDSGLSKFDPKKLTFRNYDARDGLQGNQFRRDAVYRNPAGELYFGGSNGFNSFYPAEITDNPFVPPVVLTGFKLFNKPVPIGGDSPLQQPIGIAKRIVLSHDQSVFTIEFAALNHRNAAKNSYAFKLEGFNTDWIQVGSDRRFATYMNLDHGTYTFRVKGANNDGLWNEQGATIEILVLPPWWQTQWFYLGLGILGLILLSGITFYVVRLRREIVDRKCAEAAMSESEARLLSIYNGINDALLVHDEQGRILDCNDVVCRLLGYSRQELLTMNVGDIDEQEDANNMDEHLAAMGEMGRSAGESVYIAKGSGRIPVDFNTSRIKYQDQPAVLTIIRDLTDRKQAEEQQTSLERQIQHAQKLESLGVLAGGIAHDFNNLLMVIMGNADLALLELPPNAPAHENIQEVLATSRRAADLAKQMLAYSGKGKFVVESLDCNELVKEMGHLLEVSISKSVVLKYNHRDNLPLFSGDPTQVRQIVMNLIVNASESIGEKSGVITLTTGVMNCDRAYLQNVNEILRAGMSESLAPGLYTFFEVSDNGCGMDQATIDNIFDPFFTTKFTGRGLGMSAVLGIIRGHKGALKLSSEVGKGTTFKVLFPACSQSDTALDPNDSGANKLEKWRGQGTVLLADDEEAICALGKQMLENMGFTVLTVPDGLAAVKAFGEHADEITCVLLDLTMPHMGGEAAYGEIRRIMPDAKVILCSGYDENDATQRFAGKGLTGFLQKPFEITTLKRKMMEILGDS